MTSRERVLAAVAHRRPDRVPLDIGATPSSGLSGIAYSNLLKHMGIDRPVRIYDVVQQVAQPDPEILDHFGADIIDIGHAFNDRFGEWHPFTMANGDTAYYPAWFHPRDIGDGQWATFDDDGERMLSRMPVGATFFDQTYFPYVDGYPADYGGLDAEMGRIMWARDTVPPWDRAKEPDFYDTLREVALELRRTTDKALLIGVGCNLFEWGTFLRRMDNFLMDLVADEASVERLLDELLKRHLASLEKVCKSVGDVVDIVKFGDDLGMITGPFMSPDTYRKLFKPRHKILCDYVKKHSAMIPMIHSCGSIAALMPDMIEAGFEIFNPVQTNAAGMDPATLKREFGARITFWGGGVDTASVLNRGTPAQVRAQVLERMEIFSPGGGFIFNTVHNILPDVPPENIVAMYEAVREFNDK